MHSVFSRLNAIFAFGTTLLFVMACCNAVSMLWLHVEPSAVVSAYPATLFRQHPYLQADVADFQFDLQANLSSMFTWNTKMLFVFLSAEYNHSSNFNQVVLWDKIILSPNHADFNLKKARLEYPMVDPAKSLRGKEVKLVLWYSVTPVSGLLYSRPVAETTVQFPSEYLP